MTTSMEQEKQRISERLARLDAEREKLGTQLDELESPSVFWHDSVGKRVQPRSGGDYPRRSLLRRPVRNAEREAANRRWACR